jgi:hypothetical protein
MIGLLPVQRLGERRPWLTDLPKSFMKGMQFYITNRLDVAQHFLAVQLLLQISATFSKHNRKYQNSPVGVRAKQATFDD